MHSEHSPVSDGEDGQAGGHSKEKSLHTCSECGKSFPNQSSLTKHMAVHSDLRPHECPECLKRFKRLDHLAGHMVTHRGEKPHACSIPTCAKRYSDPRSLKRHMEKQHPEESELAEYKIPAKRSRGDSKEATPARGSSNGPMARASDSSADDHGAPASYRLYKGLEEPRSWSADQPPYSSAPAPGGSPGGYTYYSYSAPSEPYPQYGYQPEASRPVEPPFYNYSQRPTAYAYGPPGHHARDLADARYSPYALHGPLGGGSYGQRWDGDMGARGDPELRAKRSRLMDLGHEREMADHVLG